MQVYFDQALLDTYPQKRVESGRYLDTRPSYYDPYAPVKPYKEPTEKQRAAWFRMSYTGQWLNKLRNA